MENSFIGAMEEIENFPSTSAMVFLPEGVVIEANGNTLAVAASFTIPFN
jgi:hypothetical protein